MANAVIDQALRSMPYYAILGVRTEEAQPGHVVLRIPFTRTVTNADGAISSGVLCSVGELAAAVLVATHPLIGKYRNFQKSTKIKYYHPAKADVTAHCQLTPEMANNVEAYMMRGMPARLFVPVKVLDGHGQDVAELVVHFSFKTES